MRELRAIRCPNCGASLKLRGGGRVLSVTCDYCKSLIDLTKEDKVLANFKGVEPPPSFFKIGMEGKISGVCWKIIGWIVYRDRDGNRWSEFLLFSIYFGYAWLVDEGDKKLYFSKRVRDLDLRDWAKGLHPPKNISYKNRFYSQYEEPYSVFIDYVEGELTWVAKRGDRLYSWDYRSKDNFINIERTEIEVESYFTVKLNEKEIEKSFKYPKSEYQTCQENLNEVKPIEALASSTPKSRKDETLFSIPSPKRRKRDKNLEDEEEEEEKSSYIIYTFALYLFLLFIKLFTSFGDDVVSSNFNGIHAFKVSNPKRFTHIYLERERGTGFDGVEVSLIKLGDLKPIIQIKNGQISSSKNIYLGRITNRTKSIESKLILPQGEYFLNIKGTPTIKSEVIVGELDDGYIDFVLWLFLIYFAYLNFTRGEELPEWFTFALLFTGGLFLFY